MRFQKRDGEILSTIYAYDGLIGRRHLQEIFWPDASLRAAQKRLHKLLEDGYLDRPTLEQRRTQPVSEPVYWIGWKGILWVAAQCGAQIEPPPRENEYQMRKLDRKLRENGIHWLREPRWLQIAHDMAIVDVRLAVERALDALEGLELEEWRHESVFRADGDTVKYSYKDADGKLVWAKKRVYPDSYFAILDQQRQQEGGLMRARLLLELDNATHANSRFGREKAAPGAAYILSREYEERFGDNSGRWLIVTTGETRMKNLMRQTKQVIGSESLLFHFSTLDQVLAVNLLTDPIWKQVGRTEPTGLFGTQWSRTVA